MEEEIENVQLLLAVGELEKHHSSRMYDHTRELAKEMRRFRRQGISRTI
ncbi:hypothetical protein B4119_3173 [Parageobacillus caldoxylosilyticus]|uniref:Uncharacterized protein n=1 Tax=Saccharococcus caldoxylosilyticus TaxID=81408 RepID=A0A150M5M0_9BACL|nr:hypothetical protein B4119_3173 [Parageobacillus caldoxylosilyticus]